MPQQPGRNDPCPCGSGKKYKKCCLGAGAPVGAAPPGPARLAPAPAGPGPRAALESLKATAFRWHSWDVDALPTEEILRRLSALGIPVTVDSFRREAPRYLQPSQLADYWLEEHQVVTDGFDGDFILFACSTLYERLLPEVATAGRLDRTIARGYELEQEGDFDEARAAWGQAWEDLKTLLPAGVRSLEAANDAFGLGGADLRNWAGDYELRLHYSCAEAPEIARECYRYTTEFLELLPETGEETIRLMRQARAVAQYHLGETEAARETFEGLMAQYPGEFGVYADWGEALAQGSAAGAPPDYAEAQRVYRLGWEHCPVERECFEERLAELGLTGAEPQDND